MFLAGKSPNIRCIYTVLANPTVLTHNPWHGTSCWAICYVSVTPVPSKGLWSLQPQVHPYTFAPKNMHGLEGPCPTAHVTAHHFFQLHMLQRIIFPAAHVTAHYFFQLHMLQCITFLASIASLEITGPGTWVTAGLSNSQAVSGHIITVLLPKEYRVWDLEGHGRLQKHISFDRSHIHCFPNYTGPEIWRDTAGSTNT